MPLIRRSVPVALLALGAAALLALRLRGRPALAALLAPLPILLPAVSASDTTGFVGDRFYHVAFVGLAVAAGLGLSALWPRQRGLVLLAGLVPVLALATGLRAAQWRDDAGLFRASLARDPDNPHAAFHLGFALHAHRGDCEAALPYYRRGLDADPRAGNNLQACLLELGRLAEAARLGPELVLRDPANPTPAANTARAHLRLAQLERAEHWAREAVQRDPSRARSWTLLGESLGARGELHAAREAFAEALARDPKDAAATRGRELAESLLAGRVPLPGE